MYFTVFLICSILESIGMFSTMLATFRLRLRDYWQPFMVIAVLASSTSFLLRDVLMIQDIAPLVLLVQFVILIRVLLRTNWLYAGIMAVTGLVQLVLLQGIIYLVLDFAGLYPAEHIKNHIPWVMHGFQVGSFIVMVALARWMYARKLGFTFISFGEKARINFKHNVNITLSVLVYVSIIGAGCLYIYLNLTAMLIFCAIAAAILISIIRQCIEKEKMQIQRTDWE
ncbi:hypothetical protein [Paenibacillus sp. y28]|uniref:hypothetical protein n=1 Tax=Paenibacillus sp. y28 TaxID=3129110 RepID=UPI003017C27C